MRAGVRRVRTWAGSAADVIRRALPPISEAEFQRQVIQFARLRGWRTAHFRPGLTRAGRWATAVQGDGAGFPDLVLVRDRVLFAELKVRGRLPTAEQVAWLKALQSAGAEAYLWRETDWPEIEKVLT